TDASPVQLVLNASNINAANLSQAAGSTTPLSGTLAANVALHGSEANPVGNGNVTLTNAKVSGETIQSLNLKFNGTGETVRTNLDLRMPAGTVAGAATIFPKTKQFQANLQSHGIRVEQLQAVKTRSVQIAGVLNIDASGQGSFDNPSLSANISAPQLKVAAQTINQLALQASIANHVGSFSLDSQAINTALKARGTVRLTGDYLADASIDTQPIPLGPIVSLYMPTQAGSLTGQTELHAT